MSDLKLIETQKQIAKEVLEELEVIDPTCILAGGAPRDWFFNKPASDLDFYIYDARCFGQSDWQKRLDKTLLDVKPLGFIEGETDEDYLSMKELRYVFEGEYYGVKIQVMIMNKSTYSSVVNHFCVDTSKIWWKGGSIIPTWDFLLAHATKTLKYNEGHEAKERYMLKMKEKYPTYRVITDDKKYSARVEMLSMFARRGCSSLSHPVVKDWLDLIKPSLTPDVSIPFYIGGY